IEWATKAIAIDDQHGVSFVLRGRAHLFKPEPDFAKAHENFSTAIALNPEEASAWSFRGQAFFMTGELERARESFRRAVSLAPNDPINHYHLGMCADRMGEMANACQYYEATVNL